MIKSELNLKKCQNILSNLKSCSISINFTSFEITINNVFDGIVESLNNLTIKEGYYNNDDSDLMTFQRKNFLSSEFNDFLRDYQLDVMFEEAFPSNLPKKKVLKKIKFFKQCFYIINILKFFKTTSLKKENIDFSEILNAVFSQRTRNLPSLGMFSSVQVSLKKLSFMKCNTENLLY